MCDFMVSEHPLRLATKHYTRGNSVTKLEHMLEGGRGGGGGEKGGRGRTGTCLYNADKLSLIVKPQINEYLLAPNIQFA